MEQAERQKTLKADLHYFYQDNTKSGSHCRYSLQYHLVWIPKYRRSFLVGEIAERLKQSRRLQEEYPSLRQRYWGQHFWAIGYGAWSTGNVSETVVQEYLEHHRDSSNQESDSFILE